MRTPSNDLSVLIGKMSKNEKSYFTKFAKNNLKSEKNYLKLFEAISKKNDATDVFLRKITGIRHMSRAKNYLYKVILSCLCSYHSEASGENIVYDLLKAANILQGKSLFDQGLKLLKKAREIANKSENDILLANIYKNEIRLTQKTAHLEVFHQLVDSNLDYFKDTLSRAINSVCYTNLSNQMFYFLLSRGDNIKDEKDIVQIQSLLNNKFLLEEKLAVTFSARSAFYNINSLCYYLLNDYEKALFYSEKHINLLNPKQFQTQGYFISFLTELSNAIVYSVKLRLWKKAEMYLQKLKKLKHPLQEIHFLLLQKKVVADLLLCVKTGNTDHGLKVLADNEKLLTVKKADINLNNLIDIFTSFSEICFIAGDYHKALKWNNVYLIDKNLLFREDMLRKEKIFNLLIHFELKNFDYILSAAPSIRNFLLYKGPLSRLEKILLRFFSTTAKKYYENQPVEIFEQLKNDLLSLKKIPIENKNLNFHIDYISWAESKIENRKMEVVIREKVFTEI